MKNNDIINQLVLNLGHRTALGRDDFLVSDCNTYAVCLLYTSDAADE